MSITCDKIFHKKTFPRKKKHYWGFQLRGDELCYVSNQNVIKIYSISQETIISRLKEHSRFIVALEFSESREIVSLSSDKLVLWSPTKHSGWIATQIITNIPGKFVASYPYQVKKKGDYIFYHTDHGTYCVNLVG